MGPDQMRLIELDGRRKGPVDRGICKDFLKVSETSTTGRQNKWWVAHSLRCDV